MNKIFSILIILIIFLTFTFSFKSIAKTEIYFSLYDDPESAIVKSIDNAEDTINIAMYYFTEREIAQAVIRAKERGVDIKIYLDKSQINHQQSKSRYLINNGIENIRISSNNYIMHNKFAVIDKKNVITGSYNWTAYAGEKNDENLLITDNEQIVKRYQDYFNTLWNNKYSMERYQELINHTGVRTRIAHQLSKEIPSPSKKLTRFMNINTASLEELNKLFGVGETIAQQIIKYREEKGGFKKPEDIKLVDGIGDTKWNVWLIDGWVITVNDE
jgi:competence ComEA-like helix-hairpin-helix protein